MEKKIIGRMREIVRNENENARKEFKEDQKDLKDYTGDFVWTCSDRGTNLIINAPFCYLQIEEMSNAGLYYACIGGHLKKVTKERALSIANGLYSRFYRA